MIKTIPDFYIKFPQFFSTNHDKFCFEGTLIIDNYPFNVQLKLPNFPLINNFKCFIKNNSISINVSDLKNSFDPNWNIEEFLLNSLPEILKNQNLNSDFESKFIYGKGTLSILNQVLECQNELNNICKMYANEELTLIKFDNFIGYDGHYLELNINNFIVEIKDHSLPNFSEDWNINTENNDELSKRSLFQSPSTISGYLKQFLKLLDNFQIFYKYINTLDHLCWVVEPVTITLKYNWRMFKLIDNVYIKVILNPLCPNSINVNLYGPTLEVEKYRQIYSENMSKWDSELDVYNNLLKIFDLMLFPCRDTTINMENEEDMNCKICLCYLDDDDHVPICSCDNLKCNLIYHISCLKRWFANSVEGKTFLNVTIGKCPFCKEKLSASFSDLLDT